MKKILAALAVAFPVLVFGQASPPPSITLGSGSTISDGAYSATAASGSAAYSAKTGARFVYDSDASSGSYISLVSSLLTGSVGFSAPSFAASVASGSVGLSFKAGAKLGLNNDGSNTYTLSEDGSNILLAAPTGKGFKFTVNGSDELSCTSGGACTSTGALAGVGITSTIGSGSNAFAAATNGSRIDFGAGASDYASSDGTTITFAGAVTVSGNFVTPIVYGSGANGVLGLYGQTAGTTDNVIIDNTGGAHTSGKPLVINENTATVASVDKTGLGTFNGGVTVSSASSNIAFHKCSAATAFDAASATLNCNCSSNITVTGAALGDQTSIGLSADMSGTNGTYSALVTGAGTMKACFCSSGTAVDPASVNVTVCATRG